MPYSWVRPVMLALGVMSLFMSLVSYAFCILVFGGYDKTLRNVMFAAFIVKAVTWSPFLGMEMYDTIFEQIYHDVNF